MVIWLMRIAFWTTNATHTHTHTHTNTHTHTPTHTHTHTHTHSEFVVLITFPLQQFLHELASLLRYMYIDRIVMSRCSLYGMLNGITTMARITRIWEFLAILKIVRKILCNTYFLLNVIFATIFFTTFFLFCNTRILMYRNLNLVFPK